MPTTKNGTVFDSETGEVLQSKPLPSTERKRVEFTTSYGKKRVRVRTFNFDPSKTDESQGPQTDVNLIMKNMRYKQLPDFKGIYADLSEVGDLHSAHAHLAKADAAFMQLPADIRSRFDNDPAQLIKFLDDPQNDEEAIDLGFKVETTTSNASRKKLERSKNVEQTKAKAAVGNKTKTDGAGKTDLPDGSSGT